MTSTLNLDNLHSLKEPGTAGAMAVNVDGTGRAGWTANIAATNGVGSAPAGAASVTIYGLSGGSSEFDGILDDTENANIYFGWQSDPNTGIFHSADGVTPASDIVYIKVNGTTGLTVLQDGSKFGISTPHLTASTMKLATNISPGTFLRCQDEDGNALFDDTISQVDDTVTRIGVNALNDDHFTGIRNTAFGYQAGFALTTGQRNTIIGYASMQSATTADDNVSIGNNSLLNAHTDTEKCVSIGSNAMANGAAQNSVAIGTNADITGSDTLSQIFNVVIGSDSSIANQYNCTVVGGQTTVTGTGTKSNNTIIGAVTTIGDFEGATTIGSGSVVFANNEFVIATGGFNKFRTSFTVGDAGGALPSTQKYLSVVVGSTPYWIPLIDEP